MKQELVKRAIFEEVLQHLQKKEVTVVTGARQTGKTTLLAQIKNWLVDRNNIRLAQIKSFNLDLFNDLEVIRNQADFIRFLNEEISKESKLFVFIDEIQRLENPGKFLKGIYDLNLPVKLVVTGSSSLEIRSKIFESLTGRKRVFHLWPFSFSEYLSHHDVALLKLLSKEKISSINKKKIMDYFFDFVIYGGYPRVALAKNKDEKIQILNEIYSSYIEKDIINFMKIKNPFAFTKLVSLLGDQTGNLLNLKEISNTLGINIRTVENYLLALENTFVVKLVRPYFTNIRKELSKMPKIYFADNGLRNLSVKYFVDFQRNRDKGKLLENFVFSSFIKKWDGSLNFWRTKDKAEVDFILKDYQGNIYPVEVKAQELRKPQVPKAMRTFANRYNVEKGLVVNLALEDQIILNKTRFKFILPITLERFTYFTTTKL